MPDQRLLGSLVLREPLLLDGFGARMTVHAPHSSVGRVAAVCAAVGIGAVYTTSTTSSRASRFKLAAATVRVHQARVGSADAVLLDAQRYSGKHRIPGLEPHDLGWTTHQHQLGLTWALTDSGYIGQSEDAALRATLAEGCRHPGQTVIALPLHSSWLSQRAEEVRDRVESAGRPVALMLEHANDPFGARRTLEGLVEVLGANVPVSLLRCDVSAVGALAHGAAVAGVGTKTSLRHIFPVKDGPGRGPADRGAPAAVVPRALAYRKTDRIREAVLADGDDTRWTCLCQWCAGRRLDWIFTEEDAFQHSLATLALLASDVLSSPDPRGTWQSKCFDAQFSTLDIATETGLDWPTASFLAHWVGLKTP